MVWAGKAGWELARPAKQPDRQPGRQPGRQPDWLGELAGLDGGWLHIIFILFSYDFHIIFILFSYFFHILAGRRPEQKVRKSFGKVTKTTKSIRFTKVFKWFSKTSILLRKSLCFWRAYFIVKTEVSRTTVPETFKNRRDIGTFSSIYSKVDVSLK